MVLKLQSPEVERRSFVPQIPCPFVFFCFCLNHLIFVYRYKTFMQLKLWQQKTPVTHLLPTCGKIHHPKSLWYGTNRTPAARSKKLSTMSRTNKRGGNNRKTAAVCQQTKEKLTIPITMKTNQPEGVRGAAYKVNQNFSLRCHSEPLLRGTK